MTPQDGSDPRLGGPKAFYITLIFVECQYGVCVEHATHIVSATGNEVFGRYCFECAKKKQRELVDAYSGNTSGGGM